MLLMASTRRGLQALPAHLLLAVVLLLAVLASALPLPARADSAAPAASQGGIVWKTCDPPPMCFRSQQERQRWASDRQCRFLEDVCEGKPGSGDDLGAREEDRGFWGGLWDGIKGGLVYGYEFVKGLVSGLQDQVTGLWDMVSNPGEVVDGLIQLGKAFYDDPQGTLKMLAELLGQEVIDSLQRATQCGAYDLGKVIGQNVNPGVVLKLATQLSRYAGDLAKAVKGTRHDLGCASFAAGTPVLTPQGPVSIEHIGRVQEVLSRHDIRFTDAPQPVDRHFARLAPRHRLLTTEFDSFRLTDEHPLWVQGKGWTRAQDLTDDDVLATVKGDVRVLGNAVVEEPLQVYNFSVRRTPSYFVGEGGVWAHNAKCAIPLPYKAPKSPSGYGIGASDGGSGAWNKVKRPDNEHFRYQEQVTGAPNSVEYNVNGVNFDGYDAKRNVLLEAKNYGSENPLVKREPDFLVREIENDIVKEVMGQIEAAKGTEAAIEWHVASEQAAAAIVDLFKRERIFIEVIYTPNISN